MKKAFLISILCVLYFIGFAQKKNFKRFTGKHVTLETDCNGIVGCGILSVVYAFKFKLINTDSTILVFIGCPGFYGKNFFIRGNVYVIDITSNLTEKLKYDTVMNSYKSENLPTYFVTNIIKVK